MPETTGASPGNVGQADKGTLLWWRLLLVAAASAIVVWGFLDVYCEPSPTVVHSLTFYCLLTLILFETVQASWYHSQRPWELILVHSIWDAGKWLRSVFLQVLAVSLTLVGIGVVFWDLVVGKSSPVIVGTFSLLGLFGSVVCGLGLLLLILNTAKHRRTQALDLSHGRTDFVVRRRD